MSCDVERAGTMSLMCRSGWIALILATAVSCSPATDAGGRRLNGPSNFGVVIKGEIYRGAQPMGEDYERLRELGIRTVLKLNTGRVNEEEAAVTERGMRLIHIPFDAAMIGSEGTCDDVARALEVMRDESNWPIYVHCTRGRDRTGYLVGLYRQRFQSWPWEKVDEELRRYGHGDRMRKVFPQIAIELEAGIPTCNGEVSGIASAPDTSKTVR